MTVRRIKEGERGARVEREWEGQTVVCIASGPSTTKEQLEFVRQAHEHGVRVMVTNDMYLVVPWADVLYFADLKWHKWHKEGLPKSWPWASFTAEQVRTAFRDFAGIKVSIENHGNDVKERDVLVLKNLGVDGWSENPDGINTGVNSGYQQLNIAVLSGAKRILLLGYDMRYDGRRTHSHNGHQQPLPEHSYKDYARHFATVQHQWRKMDIEIINCSMNSTINTFPKLPLEQALCVATA